MKKLFTLFTLLICLNLFVLSQDATEYSKEGLNFGVLPAVGFDADLGLQLGAIANIFDYGNGSNYPRYDHSLFLMGTAYTRGSTDFILFFDSFELVPSHRFTLRTSYNINRAMPFYGFNGYNSVYNPDWEDSEHSEYVSRMFYNYERELLNINLDLQDTIGNSNFSWFAGWDFGYYKAGSVDIERLNKKKNDDNLLPDVPGLYDNYVDWGIINDKEKDGGIVNSIKLGLVYDTREQLSNPMKGVWTEVLFRYAPSFLGNEMAHNKISVIHRQYLTLVDKKLSLAYRLWFNGTVGSNPTPFYARPYLTASNYYEGYGGAYTLRGVLLNRIVGEDFLLGNVELRWKMKYFNFLNQKWYVGSNLFFDAGQITKPVDWDLSAVPDIERALLFTNEDGLHSSFGFGLKLAMNENFVISLDYGMPLDERDGPGGMYLVMNYLF